MSSPRVHFSLSLPCVVTVAKLATTPLAHARDARPRPCRPYLAHRPARSSPEASSCCLSRPCLSFSLSCERRAMAAVRTLPARVTRVPRYRAPSACSHRRVAARHAPARMPAQPRACRACDAPRRPCHSAFAAPPWEQSSARRSDSTGPNPCGLIPPSWGTTLTTSTSPTTWPSASSHRVVPPPLTPPTSIKVSSKLRPLSNSTSRPPFPPTHG